VRAGGPRPPSRGAGCSKRMLRQPEGSRGKPAKPKPKNNQNTTRQCPFLRNPPISALVYRFYKAIINTACPFYQAMTAVSTRFTGQKHFFSFPKQLFPTSQIINRIKIKHLLPPLLIAIYTPNIRHQRSNRIVKMRSLPLCISCTPNGTDPFTH